MRVLSFIAAGLLGLAQTASCAPTTFEYPAEPRDASPLPPPPPTRVVQRTVPDTTFADKTIFSPPSNAGWVDPRVLYARAIELQSGALLATWENYSPEPPTVYFPIYRSLDGGETWTEVGRVQDQVNGWGLRYQPFLYQLPQAIGDYAAGTVVLAGNSIPTDLSKTKIDVYVSTDEGQSWTFVSSVAQGGEARPENGLTPVWEPFILTYNNQLVLYYADQRDSRYGQKISQQTTSDLRSWSSPVDTIVTPNNYAGRPGMPVVAALPNRSYILAYEQCGTDGCRVRYRLSADPLAFSSAPDYALVSDKGTRPVSSPYVVWTSAGGANGSIVISGGSSSAVFVNKDLGVPGSVWTELSTPQPRAYTRALLVYRDNPDFIGIIGAGWLPPSSTNYVSNSVVSLAQIGG